MTDLDVLESRLQGLERRMNLVGHLRPQLDAGGVVPLPPTHPDHGDHQGRERHARPGAGPPPPAAWRR